MNTFPKGAWIRAVRFSGHQANDRDQWADGQLTPDHPTGTPSQWTFVAESTSSTETIGFNVTDHARAFNPTVTATVSVAAANQTPTATGHSQSNVAAGAVIALSTLFTYNDPDGLSVIVSFDVKDQTSFPTRRSSDLEQWADGQLTPDQPIGTLSQWT